MLVLTRNVEESIVLTLPGGALVRIKIGRVSSSCGSVRLLIDAPHDVTVDREEVHLAKQRHYVGDDRDQT
jgi:carbon storage regulator CsrA